MPTAPRPPRHAAYKTLSEELKLVCRRVSPIHSNGSDISDEKLLRVPAQVDLIAGTTFKARGTERFTSALLSADLRGEKMSASDP